MKYTELPHFSHPKHNLKLVNHEAPYKCDGCKEMGFGLRYRCDRCNFDLHKDCIFATSKGSHAFYKKRTFQFHKRPGSSSGRHCGACGRDVKGFVYQSKKLFGSNHDLHPCCINLPCQMEGGEGLKLKLQKKASSKCLCCGKKELRKGVTGWSYVSKCKKFHFHVYCVKEMFLQNWEKGHFFNGNYNKQNDLQMISISSFQNHHSEKDKKYWRMFKTAAEIVVGVALGDPTTVIIGIMGYFLSSQ